MPETPSTHTFTGDREALHRWLSDRSHFRIADLVFPDGSVLLYGDARPLPVQGWCSVAVGQVLDDATFPVDYAEAECAAAGLACLLDRGEMMEALLSDAETAKELSDLKTRAKLLKDALGVSAEHRDGVRTFQSHVAYDIRTGAMFELPGRETLLDLLGNVAGELAPVRDGVAGAAGRRMTGTEFADLVVEAARTTLPVASSGMNDPVWLERYDRGTELRRTVLPGIVRHVLADVPEGALNEALRHVSHTRRLE